MIQSPKIKHLALQSGKWLLAVAILSFVFLRLDAKAFTKALNGLDLTSYFAFMLLFVLCNYLVDALSVHFLARSFSIPSTVKNILKIRGKTYILAMAHQHLGLGGIGYLIRKKYDVKVQKVTSMILILFFMDAIVLCSFGLVMGLFFDAHPEHQLVLILYAGMFFFYLTLLLLLKTIHLPKVEWFTRLKSEFHVQPKPFVGFYCMRLAFLGTIMTCIYFTAPLFGGTVTWLPLLTYTSATLIVGFLPITPFGVGTFPAAMGYFFAPEGSQEAWVALGLCYLISCMLLRAPIGLAFWGRD